MEKKCSNDQNFVKPKKRKTGKMLHFNVETEDETQK